MRSLLSYTIRTCALNRYNQHQFLLRFADNSLLGLRVTDAENNLLVFNTAESRIDGLTKNFPALDGLSGIDEDRVDTVRTDF